MKIKTKRIHFRVSEKEHQKIVNNSRKYKTITEYIMTMIKEFSNLTHQEKVTLSKELISQYHELCIHLSHIEGNLTQITNRINEHRANGVLLPPDIENEVLPRLTELRSLCTSLKSQLLRVTNNHCIWS